MSQKNEGLLKKKADMLELSNPNPNPDPTPNPSQVTLLVVPARRVDLA